VSPPPAVHLPVLATPVDHLWHVLLDLAEALPGAWTLIGGQMVLLHALEHGHLPPQVSQDGDVVADVRAVAGALTGIVQALLAADFAVDPNAEDIAHRFVRAAEPRDVVVDVLAPEGLGRNTRLYTVRPGRTIQAPGGTQALHRTEPVQVHHEGRSVIVPRPSLLGAIIVKAAACGLGGDVSRHHRDLALLLSLVADPFAMKSDLTKKDRQRLELARPLLAVDHPAWLLLPPQDRDNGQITYRILADAT
jgi:hypothetical protein